MAATTSVISLLTLGYSAYEGERGVRAQEEGFKNQQGAQKKAKSDALQQRLKAREMASRAKRKAPDALALLAAAQGKSTTGSQSTFLSGQSGLSQLGV